MLDQCRVSGLDLIDTATGYGDSEERLGLAGVSDMRVVTKLPPLPDNCDDVATFVSAAVRSSIKRLGVKNLYGLLLHRADDLLGAKRNALWNALRKTKAEGQVVKIGVSIYSPDILDDITDLFPIELVQAPFNVFDQRLLDSGWLERLAKLGVEVHTRSAFLQGLLLLPKQERPQRFAPWADFFHIWDDYLNASQIGPLEGALGFVNAQPHIDRVVVGAENASQLRQILAASESQSPPVPEKIGCADLALIDPSTWSAH